MTDQPSASFDAAHAATYDKNFEKLASFKDALHILTRAALVDLPKTANVLCVGAGTGAELLYLAEAFPSWTFTAVDVSGAMLEVCRQRVADAGYSGRCAFHHGEIASLSGSDAFHAATSILVSQFVVDRAQRVAFFREIAGRLRPQGRLVTADLASDMDDPASAGLLEIWRRTMQYNGASEEKLDNLFEALRSAVAVVPEGDVAALITDAGFEAPTRFFQAGLIHAWQARLPS